MIKNGADGDDHHFITCDECGYQKEIKNKHWEKMWQQLKEEGWIYQKQNKAKGYKDWKHFCDRCVMG